MKVTVTECMLYWNKYTIPLFKVPVKSLGLRLRICAPEKNSTVEETSEPIDSTKGSPELYTVEPRYNENLWTMKITLLYQVSCYIRVKKQRNIKNWDQQNDLVIRGFCYIRPLYNEVPLYLFYESSLARPRRAIVTKALFNNVFTFKNLSCMSLHAISVFDKV